MKITDRKRQKDMNHTLLHKSFELLSSASNELVIQRANPDLIEANTITLETLPLIHQKSLNDIQRAWLKSNSYNREAIYRSSERKEERIVLEERFLNCFNPNFNQVDFDFCG